MDDTNSTTGADDPSQLVPTGGPVIGMAIFWILLGLCLACVTHPLASAIDNPRKFRRYLHLSPLFCFMDSVWLFFQVARVRAAHPVPSISRRYGLRIVTSYRLKSLLSVGADLPLSTHGPQSHLLPSNS